jgi:carbamate kinase
MPWARKASIATDPTTLSGGGNTHSTFPSSSRSILRSRAHGCCVLGAQTEGMIGYMIEQELGNLVPPDVPFATLLTLVEVDPADPGFKDPTKFIGPVYSDVDAARLKAE